MDKDNYEEVSDQEEEVAVLPPIPVVAVAPLNVEVPGFPDNPESPSPEPSPAFSGGPSPAALPPGSPVGGVTSFMGFHTHDDLAGKAGAVGGARRRGRLLGRLGPWALLRVVGRSWPAALVYCRVPVSLKKNFGVA